MTTYNIQKGNIVRWEDPDEECNGIYRASTSYVGDDDYGVVTIEDKDTGSKIADLYVFELENMD